MKNSNDYKEIALQRYHLSKELNCHRRNQEKNNHINIFVSFLCVVMTISATLFIERENKICDIIYGVCQSGIIFVFLWICIALSIKLVKYVKNSLFTNKVFFSNGNDKERIKEELTNKFDYDVSNSIFVSYSLIKDIEKNKGDKYIENYMISEILYYIDRTISKLNDIFNETQRKKIPTRCNEKFLPRISKYRLLSIIDMTKKTIEDFGILIGEEKLRMELYVIIKDYNYIIENLSKCRTDITDWEERKISKKTINKIDFDKQI